VTVLMICALRPPRDLLARFASRLLWHETSQLPATPRHREHPPTIYLIQEACCCPSSATNVRIPSRSVCLFPASCMS